MQLKKSIRAVLAALITALLGAAGLVLAPGAHAAPQNDNLGNPDLTRKGLDCGSQVRESGLEPGE